MGFKNVLSEILHAAVDTALRAAGNAAAASGEGIGGRTVAQWDRCWECIGPLKTANLTPYNHCVGLYRHVVHGKTMYIGRAIELYNGGIRKRLSDYRRENGSARKHTSGRTINANLDDIITYVMVVGDTEQAIEDTKRLEAIFVAKYRPEWNKLLK